MADDALWVEVAEAVYGVRHGNARPPTSANTDLLQWMSELPTRDPNKTLHWVPTGIDPAAWRNAPIGSWVPVCDDELPVGPLYRHEEASEALRTRRICQECYAERQRRGPMA
ncbi:hypothetical protein [Amycolatopsis pigmentata]|uniref:Zinc-finger n=1 Tax=Amycolatopsis pigmentata TaxID=450801 RepID=A0ABW5FUD4_9PSEU